MYVYLHRRTTSQSTEIEALLQFLEQFLELFSLRRCGWNNIIDLFNVLGAIIKNPSQSQSHPQSQSQSKSISGSQPAGQTTKRQTMTLCALRCCDSGDSLCRPPRVEEQVNAARTTFPCLQEYVYGTFSIVYLGGTRFFFNMHIKGDWKRPQRLLMATTSTYICLYMYLPSCIHVFPYQE